jgi:hypothetical protein
MLPAGFEPAIQAIKLPQTYALERAATGIDSCNNNISVKSGLREDRHQTQNGYSCSSFPINPG